APSLLEHPFDNVPAVAEVIAKGWTFVATDYVGQGTAGVHGYLVGADEARAALDSIRAAHRLAGLKLADRVVIWGHSQGGHAALWAGSVAARYAPELSIVGVAGLAPASDLPGLVTSAQASVIGKLLSSYLVVAYSAAYADVRIHEVVRPGARLLMRDMARRCLAGKRAFASIGEALLLHGPLFRADPATGAFGERLRQNDPREPIAAPVLIAQGTMDDLVLPSLQDAYVEQRCAAGQHLDYRKYAGRDHLSLVAADSPLVPDLLRWSDDRFKGTAAADGCLSLPSGARR
ncbi:MAG TPA: lipase family protein, partial [Steroidobacteraceae bacterium]|nr:lipase family protein [Steroidobacteraceae bacterium]